MGISRRRAIEFCTTAVLADFNKNGTADAVVAHKEGSITILEGATGELLLQHSSQQTFRSIPLVGDMDNDKHLDILVLQADGKFHTLKTNRRIQGGTVIWGQMFGSSKNNNLHA